MAGTAGECGGLVRLGGVLVQLLAGLDRGQSLASSQETVRRRSPDESADCYRDMERNASSFRRHDSSIRAGQ
jgi:hypothetical protein